MAAPCLAAPPSRQAGGPPVKPARRSAWADGSGANGVDAPAIFNAVAAGSPRAGRGAQRAMSAAHEGRL
eukprot:4715396-Pyramimonas_sp.AAC.1